MSNTLLEALWARVTANIGDRIDQISGLLTEALAAATTATSQADRSSSEADRAAAALSTKADLVGGLIPTSQLPAVALTKPQVVADRAGMLALTAQEGDVAVITAGADKGAYMLGTGSPAVFSSWVALAAPTDGVTSVNGQTGVVNLAAGDVGAAPSSHTHTSAQISDATSSPTASMVMKRDSAGRAQVADPSAAADIATKAYVDAQVAGKASTQALTDGLAGKADAAVVNARPALFSGTGAPPSTIPNAQVGDWWLNTTTMELSKITGV